MDGGGWVYIRDMYMCGYIRDMYLRLYLLKGIHFVPDILTWACYNVVVVAFVCQCEHSPKPLGVQVWARGLFLGPPKK